MPSFSDSEKKSIWPDGPLRISTTGAVHIFSLYPVNNFGHITKFQNIIYFLSK